MSRPWLPLLRAWLVSIVATGSAVFIGEVMGMTPCVLCWYQRIAMFPIALVLGMSLYSEDRRGAVYALPMALIGLVIAGYHSLLVAGLVPQTWTPCSAEASCANQKLNVFWGLDLPWLSLASFAAIAAFLFVYLRRTRP